jgi:hypothetical protein
MLQTPPGRRRFVIGMCACLLGACHVGQSIGLQSSAAGEEDVPAELRRLKDANPEADAANAIARGDLRFLAVGGFTTDVPGVPTPKENSLVRTHGVRAIPGTSDNPVSIELQILAVGYAERYNKHLLDHLSRGR